MKIITDFNACKGKWNKTDTAICGNNLIGGECFALAEHKLSPEKAYIYECVLKKGDIKNYAGGLLFGVSENGKIGSEFYAATVDFKAKSASIFRNCHLPVWRIRKWLTEDEIKSEVFKLRLEIVGREISFYLNDRFLSIKKCGSYNGGYIGLYSQNAVNYFSAVKLTECGMPKIISVDSDNAKIEEGAEYTDYRYDVRVPAEQNFINLNLRVQDGCIGFINDIKTENGQAVCLKLHIGSQSVVFAAKDIQTSLVYHCHMHIYKEINESEIYCEAFRPHLCFTPKINWLNDPNGLMYNEETEEYHMFYQYNPYGYDWGNMSWGHAVSRDLVSWEEKSVVMYPDRFGRIFSGCGVIDKKNSSGLFPPEVLPGSRMVALYTYDGGDAEHGWQNIALAYSLDNGESWIKYNDGESVILNRNNEYSSDFRDPKVIWVEDSEDTPGGGKWLLIVAGGRARLFTSDDLINWKHNSDLFCLNDKGEKTELCSECPDIYPLTVKETGELKWVYNGGGKFFVVGSLFKDINGSYDFAAETPKIPLVNKDSKIYATQSFFNDPKNRRLHISWVRDMDSANSLYKYGKVWNGAMTLPKEVELRKEKDTYVLTVNTAQELKKYRKKILLQACSAEVSENSENILRDILHNKLEICADINLNDALEIGFIFCSQNDDGVCVKYDVYNRKLILDKSRTAVNKEKIYAEIEIMECAAKANVLNIRIILDVSVIDVSADNGEVGTVSVFYTNPENRECSFYAKGGKAIINNMIVYSLEK